MRRVGDAALCFPNSERPQKDAKVAHVCSASFRVASQEAPSTLDGILAFSCGCNARLSCVLFVELPNERLSAVSFPGTEAGIIESQGEFETQCCTSLVVPGQVQ